MARWLKVSLPPSKLLLLRPLPLNAREDHPSAFTCIVGDPAEVVENDIPISEHILNEEFAHFHRIATASRFGSTPEFLVIRLAYGVVLLTTVQPVKDEA